MFTSIGVSPDGIGRGGLGGTGGGERWSIEKGVDQGKAECVGAVVIDRNMD